jgi:hypothetical protein
VTRSRSPEITKREVPFGLDLWSHGGNSHPVLVRMGGVS